MRAAGSGQNKEQKQAGTRRLQVRSSNSGQLTCPSLTISQEKETNNQTTKTTRREHRCGGVPLMPFFRKGSMLGSESWSTLMKSFFFLLSALWSRHVKPSSAKREKRLKRKSIPKFVQAEDLPESETMYKPTN